MTDTATGRESLVVQTMSAEITVPSGAEVLLPPLLPARSCVRDRYLHRILLLLFVLPVLPLSLAVGYSGDYAAAGKPALRNENPEDGHSKHAAVPSPRAVSQPASTRLR